MSLGDTLMPDRTRAVTPQQEVAGPAVGSTRAPSPTEALFARTDARFDAEFTALCGSGGPEARTALERAAAAEEPVAYDRFRANPDEFGAVVGDRTRADTVGGALEALNYSKAVHAAEQEGRTPSVPGYGTLSGGVRSAVSDAAVSLPETGGDGRPGQPSTGARPPESASLERTPEQVYAALGTIRWCLAEGEGQHVTYEDLRLADRTLYGLEQPGDASMVVRQLDSEGLLAQWAEELDDRVVLPAYRGFDENERDQFYGRLANRVDADGLLRFGQALSENALGTGAEGERFGTAIATYAPADVRADFVELALPRILVRGSGNPETEFITRATIESAAGLAGRGPLLQRALADISGQERRPGIERDGGTVHTSLERLLSSGVVARTTEHVDLLSREQVTTYDSGPATRLVHALAAVDDPSFRAQTFRDASVVAGQLRHDDRGTGQRLDVEPRGQAERALRRETTTLLAARPNETLDSLMVQGDRAGVALTEQIRFFVRQGDAAAISQLIRTVQRGDTQDQDAAQRFTASETDAGGNATYTNAARLGYVAGATIAAFQGIADSDRGAAETLTSVVAEVVPVPGAGYAASEGSSEVAAGRVAGLQEQLGRLTAGLIPTVERVDASGRRRWVEVDGPEVDAFGRARRDVVDPPDRLRR